MKLIMSDQAWEALREDIRNMTPKSKLYRILKEELSKLGHWRNLPRGKPGFHWENPK